MADGFNWDEYPEDEKGGGFNWDEYPAEPEAVAAPNKAVAAPPPAPAPKPSATVADRMQSHPVARLISSGTDELAAIGGGTLSGPTAGWSDEILGTIDGAGRWAKDKFDDAPDKDFLQHRREAVKETKTERDRVKEESPYLYGGSELVSSMLTGLAAGPKIAAQAILGLAGGLGHNEDDWTDGVTKEEGINAAASGGLGAGIGALTTKYPGLGVAFGGGAAAFGDKIGMSEEDRKIAGLATATAAAPMAVKALAGARNKAADAIGKKGAEAIDEAVQKPASLLEELLGQKTLHETERGEKVAAYNEKAAQAEKSANVLQKKQGEKVNAKVEKIEKGRVAELEKKKQNVMKRVAEKQKESASLEKLQQEAAQLEAKIKAKDYGTRQSAALKKARARLTQLGKEIATKKQVEKKAATKARVAENELAKLAKELEGLDSAEQGKLGKAYDELYKVIERVKNFGQESELAPEEQAYLSEMQQKYAQGRGKHYLAEDMRPEKQAQDFRAEKEAGIRERMDFLQRMLQGEQISPEEVEFHVKAKTRPEELVPNEDAHRIFQEEGLDVGEDVSKFNPKQEAFDLFGVQKPTGVPSREELQLQALNKRIATARAVADGKANPLAAVSLKEVADAARAEGLDPTEIPPNWYEDGFRFRAANGDATNPGVAPKAVADAWDPPRWEEGTTVTSEAGSTGETADFLRRYENLQRMAARAKGLASDFENPEAAKSSKAQKFHQKGAEIDAKSAATQGEIDDLRGPNLAGKKALKEDVAKGAFDKTTAVAGGLLGLASGTGPVGLAFGVAGGALVGAARAAYKDPAARGFLFNSVANALRTDPALSAKYGPIFSQAAGRMGAKDSDIGVLLFLAEKDPALAEKLEQEIKGGTGSLAVR